MVDYIYKLVNDLSQSIYNSQEYYFEQDEPYEVFKVRESLKEMIVKKFDEHLSVKEYLQLRDINIQLLRLLDIETPLKIKQMEEGQT
eukprot:CAMPEP_0168625054 /NCGR_PEP_ID=MMETSP0449_2-20121227/9775_1 /TAXON_ID=1082188 /ORGANISM="Strombidium rassoulzadegani, Strain ras09" /LENGTH=86 /DNA_ID=CAMNT_0008666719 /DNA_START=76 /DNA_END=333 /DNA_ORIENTATION=-